jgi:hypothetical protein
VTERLLIVQLAPWPRGRRVWAFHSPAHVGPFSAGAAFRKVGGEWRCVRAVPGLRSLLEESLTMEDIREKIVEHGLEYAWARRFDL